MSEIAQRYADEFETTASRMAELLAPFSPAERVQPRRPDDADVLALAGKSRHAFYRLVESRAIACERGAAPMRRDGRRGAARIFVTLADVARWRAARFIPVSETADAGAPVSTLEAAHARHRSGGVA